MLISYFENGIFGVITSLSGRVTRVRSEIYRVGSGRVTRGRSEIWRVGSGQVVSQKMNP